MLEVDAMMAVPAFWGKGFYAQSHACNGDTGCSKDQDQRGAEIGDSEQLEIAKHEATDPFKVQADHMDWENYGGEGVKRLRRLFLLF